jgi:mRNA degradation ribonuclease J1/J2
VVHTGDYKLTKRQPRQTIDPTVAPVAPTVLALLADSTTGQTGADSTERIVADELIACSLKRWRALLRPLPLRARLQEIVILAKNMAEHPDRAQSEKRQLARELGLKPLTECCILIQRSR